MRPGGICYTLISGETEESSSTSDTITVCASVKPSQSCQQMRWRGSVRLGRRDRPGQLPDGPPCPAVSLRFPCPTPWRCHRRTRTGVLCWWVNWGAERSIWPAPYVPEVFYTPLAATSTPTEEQKQRVTFDLSPHSQNSTIVEPLLQVQAALGFLGKDRTGRLIQLILPSSLMLYACLNRICY